MPDNDLGALAAALAKAQAAFPAITRDKEVKVTSKRTGQTYTFKYAPLDKIIEKVRGPLSVNGLAVVQPLDSDADGAPALVTMLLHESGGVISSRTPIPHSDGDTAQEFGSAVTYLRRYAYTSILGIATEDDDDGNRAAGNAVESKSPPTYATGEGGSLIGTAEAGKAPADFELRQEPDGAVVAFRLVSGRKSMKIIAHDALAEALVVARSMIEGQTVSVWGSIGQETWTPPGSKKSVTFDVLTLSKITSGEIILPAPPDTTEAETPEAADGPTSPEAPQIPASGALCGAKGPDSIPGGAICTLEKDHPGRHRELATDGHSIASW